MDYTRPDNHFRKSETLKRGGKWAWRVIDWDGKEINSGPSWPWESRARDALNKYLDLRRLKRKWK